MAFSWSKQQQIAYFLIVFVTLALVAGAIYYYFFRPVPSCFDGIQNQGELGVDCGGPCAKLCSFQTSSPLVLWSRAIAVRPGIYDLVASVENPNTGAGVASAGYTFTVYDAGGAKISQVSGSTFINANESFAIVAPDIDTGGKVPARTFFEFDSNLVWTLSPQPNLGDLVVKNQEIIDQDAKPELRAMIENDTVREFKSLEVAALIYDSAGTVVGASRTAIDSIPKRSAAPVIFTWPLSYKPQQEFCTAPVDAMLVLDRSGSMGFSNKKRPYVYSALANNEPLETAKKAAAGFVDSMKTGDQIGVISFANDAIVNQTLSSSFDTAKAGISSIAIGGPTIYAQNTNISAGIHAAYGELTSSRHNPSAKRAIVLLTDGQADLPKDPANPRDPHDLFARNAVIAAASTTKQANIIFYTIGLGTDVDTDLLQNRVATDPAHYYGAADHSGARLASIYKQIAMTVCTEEHYSATIFVRENEVSGSLK